MHSRYQKTHDDSVIDNAFPLPKDSDLKELSGSVRIELYGRKLTLIRALEVDIHLTVGLMSKWFPNSRELKLSIKCLTEHNHRSIISSVIPYDVSIKPSAHIVRTCNESKFTLTTDLPISYLLEDDP